MPPSQDCLGCFIMEGPICKDTILMSLCNFEVVYLILTLAAIRSLILKKIIELVINYVLILAICCESGNAFLLERLWFLSPRKIHPIVFEVN